MSQKIMDRLRDILKEFIQNYHRGCERFSVWWTLFTASMLSIAAVFILFAIILAILYL